MPHLFGTTFLYLSVQPPRLPPSEDVSKHTFSTWPFPRRHRCALLPVDVTVRLQRLRIWTLIWLLRDWAWLSRGYWRYRNLIDWLIDCMMKKRPKDVTRQVNEQQVRASAKVIKWQVHHTNSPAKRPSILVYLASMRIGFWGKRKIYIIHLTNLTCRSLVTPA